MRAKPIGITRAFQDMRADYDAAKASRFVRRLSGVNPMGSGADYHYRNESDYLKLMERARDLDRNDPIIPQVVTRIVGEIIQDGINPDPQTGDPAIDADQKARWRAWADNPVACHSAHKLPFNTGIEELGLRSIIVDGDVMFLPLVTGELEPVEAHRCRTPNGTKQNVVNGILQDGNRKNLEYWFTRDDIDPLASLQFVRDMQRYPATDAEGNPSVFHCYLPKRFSQTRGVTAFAPIMDFAGMHGDIQFATLVKQQVAACFAILRSRQLGFEGGEGGAGSLGGETTTEALSTGQTRTIQGMSPGLFVEGAPGELLSGFSPNIPSPEYVQHITMILMILAVNLGVPRSMLLLDSSNTNFSGMRGEVGQARGGFRRIRRAYIAQLHRPTYLWKTRQWAMTDAALRNASKRSDVDIFAHRWNAPEWDYIEPLNDAKADTERLDNWLSSPRRIHAEGGREWEEVFPEIIEDRTAIITAAIIAADAINGKYPKAEVNWREVAGLDRPKAPVAGSPDAPAPEMLPKPKGPKP